MAMKKIVLLVTAALGMVLTCGAKPKTLTSDPLTGLPLIPSTDSQMHLGNEPTVLPETQMCKSKMESDFYAVFDEKFKETTFWYETRLTGFKKLHTNERNQPQTTYYKSDGSVIVSVTGEPGATDEVKTHSVLYAKFTPGLSEKAIVSLSSHNLSCQ
jgi:hypothetical protein